MRFIPDWRRPILSSHAEDLRRFGDSLLASTVAAAAEPAATPPTTTIQVVAEGTVAVKPDRAELDLGVTTDRKTATAATAENQRKMEQVLAAQNAALRVASARDRSRATAMADGLGLRVGQVISVREGDRVGPVVAGNVRLTSDKRGGEAVPIEAGSVEVSATVTVTFAVAGR
jgi:uncharacterized protein YggE